jgi:branched-chain amino acid transport system permease protein
MVKHKYPLIWIFIYAFLIILSSISGASLELVYSIAFLMVLSQSLNIALGFSGLVNLGIIAFSGVGAYTFAVLVYQNLNPYLSMLVGGFTSVIIALLIGVVVLRLKGPFFAIGTLTLMFAAKYFIIGTGIAGGSYGLTCFHMFY